MHVTTYFKHKEVEINIGDFSITINEAGFLEVYDKATKQFPYEGSLNGLFKNNPDLSKLVCVAS